MRNLLRQLSKPFPDRGNHRTSLLTLMGVGLFVTLFLFLIRPFGLQYVNGTDGLFVICLGFGGVTVLFGWVFDVLSRFVFRIRTDVPSWTLGKWIVQSSVLLAWIALGNFLYINWLAAIPAMSWSFMLEMLANTIMVGIFPVVFSGLMIQLRAERVNQQQAKDLKVSQDAIAAPTPDTVQLAPSATHELEVPVDQVRFLEAMQNYVSVSYLEEGALQKQVLRSTIAGMEERLNNTSIIRCHRSYMVNIDSIVHVSGNAQGLKLKLAEVEGLEVPVSRSYIPRLKSLLQ